MKRTISRISKAIAAGLSAGAVSIGVDFDAIDWKDFAAVAIVGVITYLAPRNREVDTDDEPNETEVGR